MIEELAPGVTAVGTAHISAASVAEVESAIRARRPARVLVELDRRRMEALEDPEAWQRTDLVRVIREGKQHLFLLQVYLASMQAKMGRDTGVEPGTEMLRAVQVAREVGAEVVLIDRDVGVTLKRGFDAMGFWARGRLLWNVWMTVLVPARGDEAPVDVDELLKTDAITRMTEEFGRFAPSIKKALIDERDDYMSSHIREQAAQAGGGGVVAVVGAGHMPGIRARIADGRPLPERSELERPPAPRLTAGKVLAWALPLAVVAIFAYLGYEGVRSGNLDTLRDAALWWIVLTGAFAALGALVALGHPWSILTAFVSAPITTLHPLLASGWFSGLVEAKVRTPKVGDFEDIKRIESMGQFWRNGVVRILLVAALTNLFGMLGFWIASGKVLRILGGA